MTTLAEPAFPVRRNTFLLSATLTCLSGMVQLAVAVATITLVLVTGIEGILGLGPAIFLLAGAFAAFPAGRLMDSRGRIPVLAGGCVAGIAGCFATALGCAVESATLVIAGFALVGVASGTVLLSRAAAADMYRPERRARGISLVLFGSLFGAALGPLVFRPLFAGKELDTDALVVPWLAAAGIMAVGLVLVLLVRPDPRSIASALAGHDATYVAPPAAPLREILRRPGVPTALLAALTSFAGMVSIMNLTGYIVVDHGHHQADVFTVISLHIVGMYALVLVIGTLVDRIGRRPCQIAGLLVMAVSHPRPRLVRERRVDVALALRARSRLELLVRRRRVGARGPCAPRRARTPDRLLRPAFELHRSRPSRSSAASPTGARSRGSGDRRNPSSSPCPRPGSCYNPPPADGIFALFL